MMQQIRVCNYVTISAFTFILYDILINMNKEIDYVWNYRRNDRTDLRVLTCLKIQRIVVQFIFIFGRYYGLVFLAVVFAVNNATGLSISVCKIYYYYVILAGTVLYAPACNIVLAMRLDVLYRFHNGGPNPGYRRLLSCLIIGESLVEFTVCIVMALRTRTEVVIPPSLVPWPGCMLSSNITPSLTLASWVSALLVSTILCAMTVKEAFRNKKLSFNELKEMQAMFKVILRDSVAFYFLIFAILLVSTVMLLLVQNELAALPMSLLVPIYSYCVSRMILNIRNADQNRRPEIPLVVITPAPENPA
ncbi:hypothetical protein PAXINDRAFT_97263 [Paxillus involutus ATCC 200175]|nr:hypothetical protein PAXINDRAFT_97263 [Paxillus involutus ATCC 200175]